MVFLAITPSGLTDALRAARADDAIWCGSDTITEADYARLKHPNLSRFIYELGDRRRRADARQRRDAVGHLPALALAQAGRPGGRSRAGPQRLLPPRKDGTRAGGRLDEPLRRLLARPLRPPPKLAEGNRSVNDAA